MKFTLKIDMGNAAFEDAGNGIELARILREAAQKLYDMGEVVRGETDRLRDINGNTVGEWKVTR